MPPFGIAISVYCLLAALSPPSAGRCCPLPSVGSYGWTRDTFALGLVVQVVPVILLSLPGGHLADQYNRKRIVFIMQTLLARARLGWPVCPIPRDRSCGSTPACWASALRAPSTTLPPPRSCRRPSHRTCSPAQPPGAAALAVLAAIFGPMAGGVIAAWLGKVTIIYVFDQVCGLCLHRADLAHQRP